MRVALRVLGILILAGCTGSGARPSAGLSFGANSSLEWWGGALDSSRWRLREFEAETAGEAGGILRMAFRRGEIEKRPGIYDFEWHDRSVDLLASKGIKVLGVLIGSTPWTVSSPVSDLSQMGFYPPDDPAEFRRYVSEVATHFRDRVSYWEIWNEPNVLFFWSPLPDSTRYALLLREAVNGIRAADSKALVISGALAPAPSIPPLSYSDEEFLDSVLSADPDLAKDLDGIGIHLYGPYPPQDPPEETGADYAGQVRGLRAVLEQRNASHLPLWATEFGFCSHDRLDPGLQADYLARAALLLSAEGVDVLIPWVLLDHAPDFRTFASIGSFECERYFGMYEDTNPGSEPPARAKPSFRMWADLVASLEGARFRARADELFPFPGVLSFHFSRAEEVLVAYQPHGQSNVQAPGHLGTRRLKETLIPGKDRFVSDGDGLDFRVTLGSTPVIFVYR